MEKRHTIILKHSNDTDVIPLLEAGEIAICSNADDLKVYTTKRIDEQNLAVTDFVTESKVCKFFSGNSTTNNVIKPIIGKKLQVFNFDTLVNDDNTWELALPEKDDDNNPISLWGREMHCYIKNNTGKIMIVTIPDAYKSFDGHLFDIDIDDTMEMNIVHDGTDYYVRCDG